MRGAANLPRLTQVAWGGSRTCPQAKPIILTGQVGDLPHASEIYGESTHFNRHETYRWIFVSLYPKLESPDLEEALSSRSVSWPAAARGIARSSAPGGRAFWSMPVSASKQMLSLASLSKPPSFFYGLGKANRELSDVAPTALNPILNLSAGCATAA